MRATVFLRKLPLNTLKHANPRGKSAGHKIHDRQFWAIRQAGLTPTDSAPLDPTAFPTSYEPCPSIKLSYLYLPPSEHSQVFDELLKIGWRIEQEGKEISLRRELDLRSCRIEVDNSLVEGPKRRELVKEWIEWIGQVHKHDPHRLSIHQDRLSLTLLTHTPRYAKVSPERVANPDAKPPAGLTTRDLALAHSVESFFRDLQRLSVQSDS